EKANPHNHKAKRKRIPRRLQERKLLPHLLLSSLLFVPPNQMSCASPPPPRPPATALAPGFRFHPTDEELVGYYLKRKVSGRPLRVDAIAEVELYRADPWDLPGKSRIQSRDAEWYFFCALDKKYATRSRTNRATGSGYWKTTGKDRAVFRGGRAIGMKKTLVFHAGRAPRGERTNWVMHEYRLEDEELARAGIPLFDPDSFSSFVNLFVSPMAGGFKDAFVVCRIFQKRGPGPQNGSQYGAPLVEEEWEDDEMPTVKEEGEEGALIALDNPVFAEMDDEEENEVREAHDKNAACFMAPDGHCESDDSVNPDSTLKTCQEQGLDDGGPHLQNHCNLGVMVEFSDATDLNGRFAVVNGGCLEMNKFAYPMRTHCRESVACPEEISNNEHFATGGITCLGESNDVKECHITEDENNISEQFLLSEAGEENYYTEFNDLLANEPDEYSSGEPAKDGPVHLDEPNFYPHAEHGLSSGTYGFMAHSNGPDLMDELIAYFDATEDMQPCDLGYESGTSSSSQCNRPSVVNEENEAAYPASPRPLEAVDNCSASTPLTPDAGNQSSSKSATILGKPDAQSDNSWDKALPKRLVGMLDAISPPPAFAAEYPTKSLQSAHHPAALSSRLTAGIVQIRGATMSADGKNWFMPKDRDAGFVLFPGITSTDVTGYMARPERMSKMPSGITVFVLRNSFHLLFLSVLFLTASFKIGVYVCTR
ncbi:hypothetical protein Taro_009902, partial [Colocasia esculenta]|nr:hypothetical protein [Colocasia esculenta]